MKFAKITALCLAALILTVSLLSCRDQKEPNLQSGMEPETVAPIPSEEQLDYTQKEELSSQLHALRASFTDMPQSNEQDFTVQSENGVWFITAYLGEACEVRVPETVGGHPVTGLKASAFAENKTLTKLYLPDSILSVEKGSLAGCNALTALRTPLLSADAASVQYLGYLFGASSYLDNPRDVPATLAYLEIGGGLTRIADYALYDCNDLICVTLPASVTAVGAYSFYNCKSLLAVNTEGLLTVGDHAFFACSSLTKMTFSDRLTSFGLGCLEGCVSLRRLSLPFVGGTLTENTYLGYLFGAETPDFAKGYYPPYLTDVTLLSTCVSIGDYAFYQCESLTRVSLSQNIAVIGARAFSGCIRLQAMEMPQSLTEIRENAFFHCISLAGLSFGDPNASMLSRLGMNAFYNCSALRSVVLPKGLTSLPQSCFAGCLSLESIDLGGVQTVGRQAFRNCYALVSVTASSNVQTEEGNECLTAILHPDQ